MKIRTKSAEQKAKYRALHPEWHAEEKRKNYAKARSDTARYLLEKAKYRARLLGIEFNITTADIPIPDVCPAIGIRLTWGGQRESSPTIDRLDPLSGYIPSNVRVISYRANRIKTNATLAEIEGVAAYLRSEKRTSGTSNRTSDIPLKGECPECPFFGGVRMSVLSGLLIRNVRFVRFRMSVLQVFIPVTHRSLLHG